MYRIIETSFWNDPKIKRHDLVVKALAVYLFSNDRAHVSGMYFFSKSLAAEELGTKPQVLEVAFKILCDEGFCSWDEDRGVVWVRNLLRKNGRGPNITRAVAKHIKSLHNTPLINEFLQYYSDYKIPFNGVCHTLSNTPREGLFYQDQEHKVQDQEKEPPPTPPRGSSDVQADCNIIGNDAAGQVGCNITEASKKGHRSRQTPEDAKRVAEEAMDQLDIQKFVQKYAHLDISQEFSAFKNHHLARQGSYYGPKKITDWSRAFHNWCSAEWKKPKSKQTRSLKDVQYDF